MLWRSSPRRRSFAPLVRPPRYARSTTLHGDGLREGRRKSVRRRARHGRIPPPASICISSATTAPRRPGGFPPRSATPTGATFPRGWPGIARPARRCRLGASHDANARRCTLVLRQHTPPTPGQADKQALPIPVALALFDRDGRALASRLGDGAAAHAHTFVFDAAEARVVLEDVDGDPVPSLLRGCSAPVRLATAPWRDLAVLAAHEGHGFPFGSAPMRWRADHRARIDGVVLDADMETAWTGAAAPSPCRTDPAALAEMLTPDEVTLAETRVDRPRARARGTHGGETRWPALHAPLAACYARLAPAAAGNGSRRRPAGACAAAAWPCCVGRRAPSRLPCPSRARRTLTDRPPR